MKNKQKEENAEALRLKDLAALWICKLAKGVLHLLGKSGTSLPGRLALRISPTLLGRLASGVTVVAVSGTNGKTTTCRMIAHGLVRAGIPCITNASGANLISGITAQFAAEAALSGRPKKKYAVIECDEATAKTVFPLLSPRIVLYTNLFRDQLDRYGELSNTLAHLKIAMERAPNAVLFLNAEDPLLCTLPRELPNPVRFFGADIPIQMRQNACSGDVAFCPFCSKPLLFSFRTVGHLGAFRCEACGYCRTFPAISVKKIRSIGETSEAEFTLAGKKCTARLPFPGDYNVYNAAAAAGVLSELGLAPDAISGALETVSCGFGRQETLPLGGGVRLILAKNPVGLSLALESAAEYAAAYTLMIGLNDKPADGIDTSWIWDADFERLAENELRISRIVLFGTRAEELLLRLKYAGISAKSVCIVRRPGALVRLLRNGHSPAVVIANYTAMLKIRKILAGAAKRRRSLEG